MSKREKIVDVCNTYLISATKDERLNYIEQLQQPEFISQSNNTL